MGHTCAFTFNVSTCILRETEEAFCLPQKHSLPKFPPAILAVLTGKSDNLAPNLPCCHYICGWHDFRRLPNYKIESLTTLF